MNTPNSKRLLARVAFAACFIGVGVILTLCVFFTWLGTYPDDVDPKNIYYVLWKHGLNNNMNLDSALVAMSHDAWPIKGVKGLTREQLKHRFGYIQTLYEAKPYLRGCYYLTTGERWQAAEQVEAQGNKQDLVFLRDSPWMVVLKNEKAIDIILCKGY